MKRCMSFRLAHRGLPARSRPFVEALEDRLPPGQVGTLLGIPGLSQAPVTAASQPGVTTSEFPRSTLQPGRGMSLFDFADRVGRTAVVQGPFGADRAAATERTPLAPEAAAPPSQPRNQEMSADDGYTRASRAEGASPGNSARAGMTSLVQVGTSVPTDQALLEALAALPLRPVTSPPPAMQGLFVSLLADTNRDATVDDLDEKGKDDWTRDLGAIYNVNFDDDNADGQPDAVNWNDQGRPFGENKIIENEADIEDLAPLVIRALGPGFDPGSMQVYLSTASLEAAQSIHVFPALTAGAESVLGGLGTRTGGAAESTRADITPYVSPDFDTTFGVEGLLFRYVGAGVPAYQQFDGYIDLTLDVEQDGAVLGSSMVRMKVAPWIMSSHAELSTEVWALNLGVTNAPYLYTAAAEPGYYGLDNTGHLGLGTGSERWFQDHAEAGWTQRPGGPKTQVTFRLPYYRGGSAQPAWVQQFLLRPDWGTFQLGNRLHNLSDYKGDYGGNLEALPPVPGYPLGRIVQGNLRSDALATFMESQEVQAPGAASPPTRWLRVGHVDETMTFLGDNRVLVADPRAAYDLMEALSEEERGAAVLFATGATPITGVVADNSPSGTRLMTGVDLTGQSWRYVRIYDSSASGSNASGQVARVRPGGLGDGYIDIDAVWDTGSLARPYSASQRTTLARLPRAGDRFVLTEGTRSWSGATPAFLTVHELLRDTGFRTVNLVHAQGQLDLVRSILEETAGGPGSLEFLSVPVLYSGTASPSFATSRSAVAFTPGAENSYPLGVNDDGVQTLYVPRQYGPRDAKGVDMFEAAVLAHVPTAYFVDDWSSYHTLDGEVHCGALGIRDFPALDWWSSQP